MPAGNPQAYLPTGPASAPPATVSDQALNQQAGAQPAPQEGQAVQGMVMLIDRIEQAGQDPAEKWEMLKTAMSEIARSGAQQGQQGPPGRGQGGPVNFAGANPTVRPQM